MLGNNNSEGGGGSGCLEAEDRSFADILDFQEEEEEVVELVERNVEGIAWCIVQVFGLGRS